MEFALLFIASLILVALGILFFVGRYVVELIGTIEALEKENERLIELLAAAKDDRR